MHSINLLRWILCVVFEFSLEDALFLRQHYYFTDSSFLLIVVAIISS